MLRARSISAFLRIGRPPGDWVLIQSGFAIERIDEERARTQMELLNRYTVRLWMTTG
jgi:hydrogenase maturation factor